MGRLYQIPIRAVCFILNREYGDMTVYFPKAILQERIVCRIRNDLMELIGKTEPLCPLGRNGSIADCGVFPKALAKKNKNGVSTGILIYVMLFAIICVLTGSSFGVLMTVFSEFKVLGASVYLIILAYMAVAVIYFIARIKYLKGKGRNLIEELKTPYDEWEAREAECKAMDEAK